MGNIILPQHSPLKYEESRLPPLQECHNATVRYIRAGLYLDAIHSVVEGLAKCEVSIEMNLDRTKAFMDIADSMNEDISIDQMPLDPPHIAAHGREVAEELLILAMIYNMALSYHLYALSLTRQEIEIDEAHLSLRNILQIQSELSAICSDSLYLYQESQLRLHNLHPTVKALSSIHSIPALENNMRHVAKLLHQQSQ